MKGGSLEAKYPGIHLIRACPAQHNRSAAEEGFIQSFFGKRFGVAFVITFE